MCMEIKENIYLVGGLPLTPFTPPPPLLLWICTICSLWFTLVGHSPGLSKSSHAPGNSSCEPWQDYPELSSLPLKLKCWY
jgi:hypothetical protein